MGETTIGTMRNLLNSVLEQTDDSEIHFQIRTALQLLTLVEERDRMMADELSTADIPDELRTRLQDLGYLD